MHINSDFCHYLYVICLLNFLLSKIFDILNSYQQLVFEKVNING